MTEEEIQAMQGQVQAMGLVISSLISALEPFPAATSAVHLVMALEDMKQEDLENNVPLAEVRARNAVAQGYLDLLSAVSQKQ